MRQRGETFFEIHFLVSLVVKMDGLFISASREMIIRCWNECRPNHPPVDRKEKQTAQDENHQVIV